MTTIKNEELLNKINQVLERNNELETKVEQLTKIVDQHEFKIQELLLLLRKSNPNTITNSTLNSSPTNTIINNNNSPPISPRNSCEITPPPSLTKSTSTDSFNISNTNNTNNNSSNTSNTSSSNNNNNNSNSNTNSTSPSISSNNSNSNSNSPNISPMASPQLGSRPRVQYMGASRQSSTGNLFKKEDSTDSLLKYSVGKDGETFYVPPITPRASKSPSMDFVLSSSLVNSISNSKSNESLSTVMASSSTIPEGNENEATKSQFYTEPNYISKLPDKYQWAIIWEYSATDDEWTKGLIVVEMETKPFAKGALRNAYKTYIRANPMKLYDHFSSPTHDKYQEGKRMNTTLIPKLLGQVDTLYVAKDSKTNVTPERYFEDVKMQMICREYGERYNSNHPPKKIEFLSAWVIEVQSGTGKNGSNPLYGIELFMKGEFKKQNSNFGSVLSDRNTPQAFSHFTYECSGHDMLVIDIQGVDDFYTDPQVHTKDGKGYGDGNLGARGIERFLSSHKCNPICLQLGIFKDSLTDTRNAHRVIRGTMLLPDVVPDLHEPEYPLLESIPKNPLQSELVSIAEISGHSERVCSLIINKDKTRLYSGSADGTVKVWDITSSELGDIKLLESFRAHRRSIEKMVMSEKYLFTASSDYTIKVWPLHNITECKYKLDEHGGEVNDMCIDEYNNVLVSCSFDKSIKVWCLEGDQIKCVKTLNAHTKSVKSIYLSGKYLFSSSNDQTIKVWDLEMMVCVFSLADAHESWVVLLRMFNNRLLSASKDGQIKEWNLSTFQSTTTLDENNAPITDTLVTRNGYSFVASEDATIKILDLTAEDTMKIIYSVKAHRSGVQTLCTDGQRLFSGGIDNLIKVWHWKDKN
ncbi:hypothetical protein DICPUDRAFT_95520 [Dictyostelium purpureum]|uniref:Alpha-type protein kinase domain-containing protein n=1 Tax=Dictyostelium purpureum TaxID=5786 RepID=F0ZX86_DICPU|nr:uncharacterized protein DICPUDRAFT_95520 [Dictyostelium purpureum]EGC31431.1 hypothetical protein DICPUDRAFT_95520 [Dictyostelium purpureum]|eukprot:XP_003292030.1 hypothetical protein DICPUDRAFT_95520 [Dictyostelium purpureum]